MIPSFFPSKIEEMLAQSEAKYQELLLANVQAEVLKPLRMKIRILEDELFKLNKKAME